MYGCPCADSVCTCDGVGLEFMVAICMYGCVCAGFVCTCDGVKEGINF